MYSVTIGKRAGDSVTLPFDFDKLGDAAKAKIISYGVQRTFNDMVGGDKFPTVEAKVAHVKEAMERYYAGDLSRARGEGVSTETAIGRSLIRAALKAKYGAKSPEWAKFTGLSDEDQDAKLDALFAKHEAKFRPEVEAELKRRKAMADKRAKMADGLDL